MKTLDNKYTRWYWDLIDSRRNQAESEKTECHHIVPRSLGGTDNNENLIHLTLREHFVAHLLLSKMFIGKDKSKMRFASRQMFHSYIPSSRIYEMVKRDANLAMRALWKDPEWKTKIIEERKIRLSDPKERERMSERMVEVWQRPEYVEKHRESMNSVWTNKDWIMNNSLKQTESWKDPVKRNNRLKNRKPHSDDRKRNQSNMTTEQNKKSWADPVVRQRRIDGIKSAAAKKKAAKEAAPLLPSITD